MKVKFTWILFHGNFLWISREIHVKCYIQVNCTCKFSLDICVTMISCEIDVKMPCEIHVKCTRCEIHIWGKMIIRLSAFRNIFQQKYLYHFAISTREIVSKALHVGFVDNMYNAPRVRNTHDPSSLTFTCISFPETQRAYRKQYNVSEGLLQLTVMWKFHHYRGHWRRH